MLGGLAAAAVVLLVKMRASKMFGGAGPGVRRGVCCRGTGKRRGDRRHDTRPRGAGTRAGGEEGARACSGCGRL